MKKYILTIFLLTILSFCIQAQFSSDTCGTWNIDTVLITDWNTTESIYTDSTFNVDSSWIYSEKINKTQKVKYDKAKTPCGYKSDRVIVMYRINSQGIIQRQTWTTTYLYKPKEMHYLKEYQKHIEKETNRKESKDKDKLKVEEKIK